MEDRRSKHIFFNINIIYYYAKAKMIKIEEAKIYDSIKFACGHFFVVFVLSCLMLVYVFYTGSVERVKIVLLVIFVVVACCFFLHRVAAETKGRLGHLATVCCLTKSEM